MYILDNVATLTFKKRSEGNQLGLVEHRLVWSVAVYAHDCPAHWLTGLTNENWTAGAQMCVLFEPEICWKNKK